MFGRGGFPLGEFFVGREVFGGELSLINLALGEFDRMIVLN